VLRRLLDTRYPSLHVEEICCLRSQTTRDSVNRHVRVEISNVEDVVHPMVPASLLVRVEYEQEVPIERNVRIL